MMSKFFLETDRLAFRKFVREDIEALFEIQSNSDVMRYAVNGPSSEESVHRFIDFTLARYEKDGVGQWAVIEKKTNLVIGECGLSISNIDRQTEHNLAFRLSRKFWTKGFATEAALACRNYGFKNLGLERIISIQDRDNKASLKVLHKIGMKLEKETQFHHKIVQIYSVTQP